MMRQGKRHLFRVYFKQSDEEVLEHPIIARTKNEAKIIALVTKGLDKYAFFDTVYVESLIKKAKG